MNRILPSRALLAVLLAFALLGAGLVNSAEARPRGGGPRPEAFLDRHADELGLDDETRAAIEAIVEAARPEGEALRAELHAARLAMRALLDQDAPDEDEVMAQAERIGQVEIARSQHRLKTLLAIRAKLSPEQRAQLSQMHEERRARRMGRMLEACGEDAARLCPDVPLGPPLFGCLHGHRDELSQTCSDKLRRKGRRQRGPGPHGGPPSGR